MGFVKLTVRVANAVEPGAAEDVEMLADSGALYSILPATLLDRLGIRPTHAETFGLADGRTIERQVGFAHFRVGDRQGLSDVIFGELGDSTLLGVVTLGGLGLVIDPVKGELKPIEFRLGAFVRRRTEPLARSA